MNTVYSPQHSNSIQTLASSTKSSHVLGMGKWSMRLDLNEAGSEKKEQKRNNKKMYSLPRVVEE